MPGATSN
jgi:hypothetical protein